MLGDCETKGGGDTEEKKGIFFFFYENTEGDRKTEPKESKKQGTDE